MLQNVSIYVNIFLLLIIFENYVLYFPNVHWRSNTKHNLEFEFLYYLRVWKLAVWYWELLEALSSMLTIISFCGGWSIRPSVKWTPMTHTRTWNSNKYPKVNNVLHIVNLVILLTLCTTTAKSHIVNVNYEELNWNVIFRSDSIWRGGQKACLALITI